MMRHDKLISEITNKRKAELLSKAADKELLEQAEDVQLASIAEDRMASFDRETAISHEEMKRRYG